jgi:excisionase family DNA binding protein
MNTDGYLTTEEVLDYLKVNLRTVYRLIKARKIPAVRVGRQWRFRKTDIDAWLQTQGGLRPEAAAATPEPVEAQRPQRVEPRPPGRGERVAARRHRVLVVDDEDGIRELLRKTLQLADYDVDVAEDGRAALERLRLKRYDLLITDLRMPGIDGLAVIRDARRLRPDLPVIIITGYSTEATAIEAIDLGVQGYLTKPFRVPRVLNAAAKALGEPVT